MALFVFLVHDLLAPQHFQIAQKPKSLKIHQGKVLRK